jgi:GTPase
LDAGIPVSARSGLGLESLAAAVSTALSRSFREIDVEMGVENGRMLAFLAAHGEVLSKTFFDSRVLVRCRISQQFLPRIEDDGVVIRPRESGNGHP